MGVVSQFFFFPSSIINNFKSERPLASRLPLVSVATKRRVVGSRVSTSVSTSKSTAATTAAAPSVATPATASAAAAPREAAHFLELWINFLLRLSQNSEQVAGLLAVVLREKGNGCALLTGTAGTANAVHVVLGVGGVVVVNDKVDALDV